MTDEKDSEVTDEKETSNESGEENKEKSDGETTKDADISKDVPSAPMAVARDLAKALVQIEKGIEHRFLVPPFGKNITVKPVLSGHSKIDKTKILMTNGTSMKVESIAECFSWKEEHSEFAFDMQLAIMGLENHFGLLFEWLLKTGFTV